MSPDKQPAAREAKRTRVPRAVGLDGPSSARREPATVADRRQQIIEACVRAIADEGLSAASVRVFARRAGVSVGALQHYFNSKDELILGCLAHVYDGYLHGTALILARPAPARQRLERLVRWMLGDKELDELWRVWLAFAPETIREPRLARVDFDATARWRGVVSATVQEAIDDGELAGDAASLTTEIATVVNGALLGIHSRPPRLTREAAITLCLKLLQDNRAGA